MSPRPSRRLKGHKVVKVESSSGRIFPDAEVTCECGQVFGGFAHSQKDAREKHRAHKADVAARLTPRTQER